MTLGETSLQMKSEETGITRDSTHSHRDRETIWTIRLKNTHSRLDKRTMEAMLMRKGSRKGMGLTSLTQ
jgi:hypothetical protein